jgi:hypothetical protein
LRKTALNPVAFRFAGIKTFGAGLVVRPGINRLRGSM